MDEISKEMEEAVKEESESRTEADSLSAEEIEEAAKDSARLEKITESMGEWLTFSDYYKKWVVRLGIIGLIVSIIFAVAGVLLIIGKPISIKIAYLAIGLSIAQIIFQIIIMSMDEESGMIASFTNIGAYFMLFLDIILLVIILASDKSFFDQHEMIEV